MQRPEGQASHWHGLSSGSSKLRGLRVVSQNIRWTRDFWEAIHPVSNGGVYVNFLGNEGEERVRAAYGAAKYTRLVALQNQYDPTNLFCLNQNIKLTV